VPAIGSELTSAFSAKENPRLQIRAIRVPPDITLECRWRGFADADFNEMKATTKRRQ
jgi:hypothetical protein